jgi:hypothetical protein
MTILVTAQQSALSTAKQIGCRPIVLVEGSQKFIPLASFEPGVVPDGPLRLVNPRPPVPFDRPAQ